MNDKQAIFANSHPQLGHLLTQVDTFYQTLPGPIKTAYDSLGSAIKFGCHCDLDPGQAPDGCVISEGEHHLCIYAKGRVRPESCEYWKPIDLSLDLPNND